MDLNYINIIGTIKDNSTNSTVAESSLIYDRALDKKQSEVNTQVYQKLSALENNKEKCLGFFTSSELLPTDDVQLGSWAIVPGNAAWYIWTYNGSLWQQTSEEYAQQEIDIQGLATVASSGSYDDLSNKPTRLSLFVNDSGYLTQNDLAPVATTGSYTDLTDKPTILSESDVDARVTTLLNSSGDAIAALRELIDELESDEGASAATILASLNEVKGNVTNLDTRLSSLETSVQLIIDNPTSDIPKHIIVTEDLYDENNYESGALYFILSSSDTSSWTFGANFPIKLA